MYHQLSDSKILYFAHEVYFWVSYYSQIKQQLFLHATLIRWFFTGRNASVR
jgi:hypothetical protein